MSLDCEDGDLPKEFRDGPKKERVSYTREFLVSLGELDVCKKFPIGFDQSILSEFEGFSHTVQDRQRPPGSAPLQSYRRTEYGVSPPTRGDSSNYSRGVHGRWDNRNRDNESQSDWDSDGGRRYANQRRTWQNPEHDGLLGSGSFPRTSGYSAGTSASKTRANDPGQLCRSNEPYQPPRPYKAVPHPRRDTHDSINDETFGSSDTSEDRVEEERKRRAAFELMRKEQHETFQEKKHRDDSFSDTTPLSEASKDENLLLARNREANDLLKIPASNKEPSKPLSPSQTLASTRPLIPPGFTITSLEKDVGTKSAVHPLPPEVKKAEIKNYLVHAIGTPLLNYCSSHHEAAAKQLGQNLKLSEVQLDSTSMDIPLRKSNEKLKIASEVSNRKIAMDDDSYMSSNITEASDLVELSAEKNRREKTSTTSKNQSTSILEKLFDSALRVKSGESYCAAEHHDSEIDDDTWNPSMMQSSRFAHWFHEEEKKSVDDVFTGKTNDLLSFIVGEGGVQHSDTKPRQKIGPDFPSGNSDFIKRDTASDIKSANVGISEKLYLGNKPKTVPLALTCEDLEQSILLEINDSNSILQPPVQELNVLKGKTSQVKNNIDKQASQHLLSLLNKGTGQKDTGLSSSSEAVILPQQHGFEASSMSPVLNNSIEATLPKVQDLGKTLTLETLFGTAFMNELQSFEAPVSVHRALVGPERVDNPESHELRFPLNSNSKSHSSHSINDETRSKWNLHESTMLAQNHILQIGVDKVDGGRWLGFNDPQTEVNHSKLRTEVGFNLGGFNGAAAGYPKEDSLIIESATLSHRNSLNRNRSGGLSEKVGSLNAVFKDERTMIETDIRYQNLHGQPSSSQLFHSQINHGRAMLHPLDSHSTHINTQMKFPDNTIRHDPSFNHQYSTNTLHPPFHHPNSGVTGFDSPARYSLLQQMQRPPENFPPSHLMQGFPGGATHPPHLNNQAAGFVGDPMQGLPFAQRPNFGGPGMSLQGLDNRGVANHPEVLQRMMERELRSNAKPVHPSLPHQGQGTYGHETETSFRYR